MKRIENLTHEELKRLHGEGKITISANLSQAMHICDRDPRIPKSERVAHHVWKTIWFLFFIGGPISFFFVNWYWALLLFAVSVPLVSGLRQTAGQVVVATALQHEGFYYDYLPDEVLYIYDNTAVPPIAHGT